MPQLITRLPDYPITQFQIPVTPRIPNRESQIPLPRRLKYGATVWNAWRRDHPELAISLDGADLNGMILTGIDFSHVSLRGASLHATNLMNANLSGADLSGANLKEADLIAASLRGARLTGANLYEADLLGADLTGAVFTAEDLRGALHVSVSPR
jgi:uncharacterized protein YjbI with pentapeptide repeats